MNLIYWLAGIAAAFRAARWAFNRLFPIHEPTQAERDFDDLSNI